jgi:hypothetical protein
VVFRSSQLAAIFLSGGKKITPKSPTFHACKTLAGSLYPIKTTENNDDNTPKLERQTFLKITPKGDKTYLER